VPIDLNRVDASPADRFQAQPEATNAGEQINEPEGVPDDGPPEFRLHANR
jgi:hypothetical protein